LLHSNPWMEPVPRRSQRGLRIMIPAACVSTTCNTCAGCSGFLTSPSPIKQLQYSFRAIKNRGHDVDLRTPLVLSRALEDWRECDCFWKFTKPKCAVTGLPIMLGTDLTFQMLLHFVYFAAETILFRYFLQWNVTV
jgi:hypothetical protein